MKPNDGSDAGTGGRPRHGRNCLKADGGEAFSASDGRVSSASCYALNGTYLQPGFGRLRRSRRGFWASSRTRYLQQWHRRGPRQSPPSCRLSRDPRLAGALDEDIVHDVEVLLMEGVLVATGDNGTWRMLQGPTAALFGSMP
jgi:hypothetical protein